MALTMRPFAYPGCALNPLKTMVIASAEKFSISISPRFGAVERIGEPRAESVHVEMLRAAADFFVRREADFDRTVRNVGMRHQMFGGGHDLRHA